MDELKRELAEEPHDFLRKYRVVFAEGRGVAWDHAKHVQRATGDCRMRTRGVDAKQLRDKRGCSDRLTIPLPGDLAPTCEPLETGNHFSRVQRIACNVELPAMSPRPVIPTPSL